MRSPNQRPKRWNKKTGVAYMMTKEEFYSLLPGDLVINTMGIIRPVLEGAGQNKSGMLLLPKVHYTYNLDPKTYRDESNPYGWNHKITTLYVASDNFRKTNRVYRRGKMYRSLYPEFTE